MRLRIGRNRAVSRAGQNGGRSPVSGIFREMRSNPLKQSLQDGALDVVVVLDAVLLGVAGQHQGQSAVAGDVAGGAEAVLPKISVGDFSLTFSTLSTLAMKALK